MVPVPIADMARRAFASPGFFAACAENCTDGVIGSIDIVNSPNYNVSKQNC